jgi:uncharacterized protein
VRAETNVHIGIHLIFGLPNETDEQIIETAQIINDLPIDSVKLHNLHVLKNTPLEDMYNRGDFAPIALEEYSRRVILFLRHLKPEVAIHRLAAMSNRWNELVAPEWTRFKMGSYQYIIDRMTESQVRQGDLH